MSLWEGVEGVFLGAFAVLAALLGATGVTLVLRLPSAEADDGDAVSDEDGVYRRVMPVPSSSSSQAWCSWSLRRTTLAGPCIATRVRPAVFNTTPQRRILQLIAYTAFQKYRLSRLALYAKLVRITLSFLYTFSQSIL